MPNIVTNLLDFGEGEEAREAFHRMLAAVCKDGEEPGSISFDWVIPMPQYVRESIKTNRRRNSRDLHPIWYTWRCEHWGSKWDAINYLELSPEDNTMCFTTAWSPVPKVVAAISKWFPEQTIRYRWAEEENPGTITGEIIFRNGERVSERIPNEYSPEALAMSAAVLGIRMEDMEEILRERSEGGEKSEKSLETDDRGSAKAVPARKHCRTPEHGR